MAEKLLVVENIVKDYPAPDEPLTVLKGVSFEMEHGESLAIMGPSGSGKSTLLNILGAIDIPNAGRVFFDGKDIHSLPEPEKAHFRNREVGFVFQDHHLLPQCTTIENVLIPCLASRVARAEDIGRAEEILSSVGLGERRNHFPYELSGGERQRVAIARALMNKPKLLLCDEPTGNLDELTSETIGQLLSELEDVAVIVVTHNESFARFFKRRLHLRDGRLNEQT